MNNGYVKIYRQLLDNPVVCKDAEHFAVWMYLLLEATHTEIDMMFNGRRITLQPGQLITGRKIIAEKFDICESKVKRILISFENDQQIDRQRSNKNSLITVLNWCKYQSVDQQNGQRVTSNRPASDQQVTTNKNVKNAKNAEEGKKSYAPLPLEQAISNFIEHRKKLRKPMTDHAVDLLRKKLDTLAKTDTEKIALVENAIERGWQSVFPLDDKKAQGKAQSFVSSKPQYYERPTGNYDHLAIDPFEDERGRQ